MKLLKNIKLKNILILTLAGIINAFGVTVFLNPVNLYDSGISGTAMLLSQLTPPEWSLSLFLLILNVPLFLYGLKKQGTVFTVSAIYTVCVYSAAAYLICDVLPIDVSMASPLAGTDLLLCAIFGGLISGIGSGLAIRGGGAMDGIEVMSVIFSKRLGISVGTFVMIYNVLLYITAGIAINSWILPLYSIVTYAAALKVIDFIVEGMDRAKCAMIVTTKPEEIRGVLTEEFKCGMTLVDAEGGYSKEKKTIIYFVVNRFQITRMKNLVRESDPAAFITISEIADVFKENE